MSEQPSTTEATQDTTKAAEASEAKVAETLYPSSQAKGKETPAKAEVDAPKANEGEKAKESKPTEEKKDEGKESESKEEQKKETVKEPEGKKLVPEKYELKLPKDSLMDPSRLKAVAEYAKKQGLSQDEAQAVLERENDAVLSYAALQKEAVTQKASEWIQAVESDKEIGGAKFKENAELAHRALDRFASPALRKQLDETGLGNHPELVRAFVRIGKAMANDKMILPGAKDSKSRSYEDVLYGTPSESNQ